MPPWFPSPPPVHLASPLPPSRPQPFNLERPRATEAEERERPARARPSDRAIHSPSVTQEWERALRRLAGRLGELTAMETGLGQQAAAGDSALLEQQLEQLHGQWEELCTKVSARPRGRREGERCLRGDQ